MSLGPPPSRHVSLTHTGDTTFKFVSSLSRNLASIRELFPKLTSVPSPVKNARDFHQLFSPVSNMPHVFKRRQRFPGEKWLGRDHFGNCSLKIYTKFFFFFFFLMRGIPLLPEWSLTLPSWGQCLTDVKEFHMKSPSKCWTSGKMMSVEPRGCVVGDQGNGWTLSVFVRGDQISYRWPQQQCYHSPHLFRKRSEHRVLIMHSKPTSSLPQERFS